MVTLVIGFLLILDDQMLYAIVILILNFAIDFLRKRFIKPKFRNKKLD